jgi:hypothetical protein
LLVTCSKCFFADTEFEYCLYVPEDESPININKIIEFYHKLLIQQQESEIIFEIRKFAEENCDISKTMLPVIEYLK